MESRNPRIIVGVDGSESSIDAARWAVRQAELTGGSLIAIISWEAPVQYGMEFANEPTDWENLAGVTLGSALAELGALDDTEITQLVVHGHPARVLIDASAEAELLVVGSRGHGGFVGMLLGSISEYVIAHAECPVVVVRHPSTPRS
jgi:nucleotide-binding universal stress UspA family protein